MKNAIKRLIERFHPPREEVGAQWSGILCRSVSEGFTEDPNFSMQERVEQVTIPAGEMSWEEWQGHLDAMSARDGVTLVYNPGEYVDCSGIQVSIADLFVPHPFPITFQQDFTYTPVYPATHCTGNDMNIVVATFRAEHHTNVNERTF
jgi:hypothetical protein